MIAANFGFVDVLRALIDGGADLNKALPVTTYFNLYPLDAIYHYFLP